MVEKKRMQFTEEVKKHIVRSCPGNENLVRFAIRRWEDGQEAQTPLERGVFKVCETVQREIEAS